MIAAEIELLAVRFSSPAPALPLLPRETMLKILRRAIPPIVFPALRLLVPDTAPAVMA